MRSTVNADDREPLVRSPAAARDELEFIQSKLDCCLVIDGESLQVRASGRTVAVKTEMSAADVHRPLSVRVHRGRHEAAGSRGVSLLTNSKS